MQIVIQLCCAFWLAKVKQSTNLLVEIHNTLKTLSAIPLNLSQSTFHMRSRDTIFKKKRKNRPHNEANSLDRINMTNNWLEYDGKIFTTMNLIFWIWPKFATPTNINTPKKKYAGAVGFDRSPSPSLQARTGKDTCLALLAPSLCSYTRKNIRHGNTEEPGRKVKVCRFHKVRRFQFQSSSIIKVCRCHGLVKFIRSSWYGQVNNPQHNKKTWEVLI